MRLTPSALAISTSDGNLSPGANLRDTINCSSQLPMRIWAGSSVAPATSGRSASSGSSIVNPRIGKSSAVPGADPVQQIMHDFVFEPVADEPAHPCRGDPAL